MFSFMLAIELRIAYVINPLCYVIEKLRPFCTTQPVSISVVVECSLRTCPMPCPMRGLGDLRRSLCEKLPLGTMECAGQFEAHQAPYVVRTQGEAAIECGCCCWSGRVVAGESCSALVGIPPYKNASMTKSCTNSSHHMPLYAMRSECAAISTTLLYYSRVTNMFSGTVSLKTIDIRTDPLHSR